MTNCDTSNRLQMAGIASWLRQLWKYPETIRRFLRWPARAVAADSTPLEGHPAEVDSGQSLRGRIRQIACTIAGHAIPIRFMSATIAGVYFLVHGPLVAAADIQEIFAAWESRLKSVSSVHVTWTSTATHFQLPDRQLRCPGDYAFDRDGRYRLAMVSINEDSELLSANEDDADGTRIYLQNSEFVFDGRRSVVLFGRSDRPNDYFPTAFIGEASPGVGSTFWLLPLRMLYHPVDVDMAVFQRSDLRLTDGEVVDGGTRCLILAAAQREEVWVTADEHYLPVRFMEKRQNSDFTLLEARVGYARDSNQSWCPSSWTLLHYGIDGETVLESREATVESVKVNETLPDELFQITEFEDGTWISESVNGEKARYIIRDGRPNRPVYIGEYTGDNYEYLYNSEPPEHLVTHAEAIAQPSSSRSWLIVGVNVLLVLGIVAFFLRRRHRPSGTGNE